MRKLILPVSIIVGSLAGQVMADECQTGVDGIAAELDSTEKMTSSDAQTMCRAFTKVNLDSRDVINICIKSAKSEADSNRFIASYRPLMARVATGEEKYCKQ